MHRSASIDDEKPAHVFPPEVITPLVCREILCLREDFDLLPGLFGKSDYYELRQVVDLKTNEHKLCKVYRKAEFTP